MNGEAVKELAAGLRKPVEISGFIVTPNDWTAQDPVALVKAGPSAKTLSVNTLGAVRDYLKANRDKLTLGDLVVHVVSPTVVQILGPLDARSRTREIFVHASCADLTTEFLDRFHQHETFMIGLQARFTDLGQRADVLRLLGTIKSEQVKQSNDDGVSQIVTARNGSVLVSEVPVPNPVTLAPFRTFREVQQPLSPFVMRVQGGKEGGMPTVGLFEADGGAWRLVAIERVEEWLAEALPEGSAVLA